MQDVRLEPPGAGVPFLQQAYLRFWLRPFVAAKSDWDEDTKLFNLKRDRILEAVKSMPLEKLEQRILVPPQAGLEDSSRYWSASMVLDHLVIVNTGVSGLIVMLSGGVVPEGKRRSTADVKPMVGKPVQETIEAFEISTKTLMQDIDAKIKDRKNTVTYDHAWFGPMNTHQWHWLMARHMGIHLKQLREILKRV